MHRLMYTALTTAAATVILAAAVGAAAASQMSTGSQTIRATWSRLQLSNTFSPEQPVECQVTLEGSFHSNTIQKTRRALIGYVSRSSVNACTTGSATIDQESLPWHLTYESFSGTLPNITSVALLLVRASFLIGLRELLCRAVTTTTDNASGIAEVSGETITGLAADPSRRIPLTTIRGFGCGLGRGFFEGTAAVTQLGTTRSVTVTLIGGTPPSLSPTPVEFGRVEQSELNMRTVTILAGTEALTINSISVRSANYFAITDPNRCIGTRLAAESRCAFTVLFAAPGEAGRTVEDTVIVENTVRRAEATIRGAT